MTMNTKYLIRLRNLSGGLRQRCLTLGRDAGMSTAEYAIGTLAACGFAAALVAIMRSSAVKTLLLNTITKALSLGG